MCSILFKAKRLDNGEWVEGSYVWTFNELKKCPNIGVMAKNHWIVEPDGNMILVDESTVCRYTGLNDVYEHKIWENDVVQFEDTGEEGFEHKEGFEFVNVARVEFAEARWSITDFAITNSNVAFEMYNHTEFMDFWGYCEVIGNIFDNPELIGNQKTKE